MKLQQQLNEAKAKIQRLSDALAFYAAEETYFKVTDKVRDRPIGKDKGKRARDALKEG